MQSHVLSLFLAAVLGNQSHQRDQRRARTGKSLALPAGEAGTVTDAAAHREDNKKLQR